MKKQRAALSTPPAGEVAWRVTRHKDGEVLGTVEAQTWFAARRKAMAKFGVEAVEVLVSLVPERRGV